MQILKRRVSYQALAPFLEDNVEIPAGVHKGYLVPSQGEYFMQASNGIEELDNAAGEFGGPVLNVTNAVEMGLLKVV
ncbi:hypothetical protein ELI30_09025 [Rhizobium leguminosarum]|uniref:hypothetical protein n=1 Tax=Rhizobium leguminosarum TaxID=384 RepID=UPI0010300E7D|nr:hypothetical protein [Rhizobium leguminosarum]TAV48431.1 hypothetical protein ELI32_09480 [Rhizobium leguminosarum]TAV57931.1 hypothetical protein ELI31_09010 [Rhizobium leguminosarum]TAV68872.1 hypothetical protein ELI30_09025 [Rhizobium leguminosarum]